VPGLDGYAVDDAGSLWSRVPKNGKGPLTDAWRKMAGTASNRGRYTAVTCKRRRHLLHRLVALAFHGPCPPGFEVSHLNGDGRDNRPCNLRYTSHAENESMKAPHGTSSNGSGNANAKLTDSQVEDIRRAAKSRGVGAALARQYGVSQATISFIRSGKRWAA
jgi:hypothetical protein